MILQPHLINNFLDKFGDEVLGKRLCRTAGGRQDLKEFDLTRIRKSLMRNYRANIVQASVCSSV